eukprot:4340130-Amphidinium_carterae.1
MSPKRTSEQPAMIQDYTAVRGQSQSPRGAGREQPYSTPAAVPQQQSLVVEGPPFGAATTVPWSHVNI